MQHSALTGSLSVILTLQESTRSKAPGSWAAEVEEKALDYAVQRPPVSVDLESPYLLFDLRRNARTAVRRNSDRRSVVDVARQIDQSSHSADVFDQVIGNQIYRQVHVAVTQAFGLRGAVVLHGMVEDRSTTQIALQLGVSKRTVERLRTQVQQFARTFMPTAKAA